MLSSSSPSSNTSTLPPSKDLLQLAQNQLGDPRYTYVVVFPIMFWCVGPRPGGAVLITAALAEWMNILLKWLLQGDRPYWWVGEHANTWNSSMTLLQTPITCETGPGMPSGHVMISLSVLLCCSRYVLINDDAVGTISRRCCWQRLAQCLALSFATLIGVTRVLVATHFIHQVVFGLIVGYILHSLISISRIHLLLTTPTSSAPLLPLLLSSFIFVSGILFYWTLLSLNFDPAFSVPLAQRHCLHLNWVHLDTTPFYSLIRSTGSVLGMNLLSGMGIGRRKKQVLSSNGMDPVQTETELGELQRRAIGRGGGHGTGSSSDSEFGTGSTLVGLVVAGAGIGLLGSINGEALMFGDKIVGFYVLSLIKAALVPLVTVAPSLFL